MTKEESTFKLGDNTEYQSREDVRKLICCETQRAMGYIITPCTRATSILFITDDNPGFISGQARQKTGAGNVPILSHEQQEIYNKVTGYVRYHLRNLLSEFGKEGMSAEVILQILYEKVRLYEATVNRLVITRVLTDHYLYLPDMSSTSISHELPRHL